VTLLLTFLALTASLTALFWGLSLFVQPYLLSETVQRLGLRSLAGGVLLAGFLTGWTYLNTRASHPGKYDTLLEFTPTLTIEIHEFDAVHRLNRKQPDGQWLEETVTYRRANPTAPFLATTEPYDRFAVSGTRNGVSYMTTAILVKEPGTATIWRMEPSLSPDGKTYQTRAEEVVFRQKGGSRYLEAAQPGTVYVPSLISIVVALILNLLHFAIWFIVFWPLLRYPSGTALGLAFGFGLLTMLVIMPLLFQENRQTVRTSPPRSDLASVPLATRPAK